MRTLNELATAMDARDFSLSNDNLQYQYNYIRHPHSSGPVNNIDNNNRTHLREYYKPDSNLSYDDDAIYVQLYLMRDIIFAQLFVILILGLVMILPQIKKLICSS